ncbi:hypothetical protein Vafri_559 [Volvox africanus]|nr:hypothetical protein Vafri_559 [Volvox africanus]
MTLTVHTGQDIVAKTGPWMIEDWLRWVDCCYSIYILHDSGMASANSLLPTVILEVNGTPVEFNLGTMWFQFRTALLHYLRYDPTNFSEDANDRAAKAHASFSSAAEHVFVLYDRSFGVDASKSSDSIRRLSI